MSDRSSDTHMAVHVVIDGKLWILRDSNPGWVDEAGAAPDADAANKLRHWLWGMSKKYISQQYERLPRYWSQMTSGTPNQSGADEIPNGFRLP